MRLFEDENRLLYENLNLHLRRFIRANFYYEGEFHGEIMGVCSSVICSY
jgi:hypothetical protein